MAIYTHENFPEVFESIIKVHQKTMTNNLIRWKKILFLNSINEEIRCVRCKGTYFFDGCPSCGNTFLSRDILRQTS